MASYNKKEKKLEVLKNKAKSDLIELRMKMRNKLKDILRFNAELLNFPIFAIIKKQEKIEYKERLSLKNKKWL